MIIEVTQQNIDDAHRNRDNRLQLCRYCAIALAAKDAGLVAPRVTSTELSFETTESGWRKRVLLPPAAIDLLERFDRGEHVEPIVFAVDLKVAA